MKIFQEHQLFTVKAYLCICSAYLNSPIFIAKFLSKSVKSFCVCTQKRGIKENFNYVINRNAYVLLKKKKSAQCISECITRVAHGEVSCSTRVNLIFVLCCTLPTLALKGVFFRIQLLRVRWKGY